MSRLNRFLEGVTVLDLGQYLPGPLAGLILADMGARVIKIERPDGDPLHRLGPRSADGAPLLHEAVNAGKDLLRLDLRTKSGRAAFLDHARAADVLIESFRPGVMDRLGLGDSLLKRINPQLIRCSMSGYGAQGPLATVAGHDINYLASAGILHRNGEDPFDPPVADCAGALFAAVAILGALLGRRGDDSGCRIDLALADAVMPLQLFALALFGGTGREPQHRAWVLNGGAACYRGYSLGDGTRVVLGALEPKFWRTFCEAAGHDEWISRQHDSMPQLSLSGEVQAFFKSLDKTAFAERFSGKDCCASLVVDLADAIRSEHVRARDLVREAQDGQLQALFPARVDGLPPRSRPALNARTRG